MENEMTDNNLIKSPACSYVIMHSFTGINANGVKSKIVEPILVYTNEEKALRKVKDLKMDTDGIYWVWSTQRGK